MDYFDNLADRFMQAMNEAFSSVNESFQTVGKVLVDGVNQVVEMGNRLDELLKDASHWQDIGEKFGANGWVFPLRAAHLNEILSLYEMLENGENANFDVAMIFYYDEVIDYIVYDFNNYIIEQHYINIFAQSLASFRCGHIHPAVVSLVTIIDGLLTDALPSDKFPLKDKEKTLFVCRSVKLKEALKIDAPEEFFAKMEYYSFSKVITEYFNGAPFSEPEPPNFNRHWVLHGRSRRMPTKKDYYQLLGLLDTLLRLAFETTDETSNYMRCRIDPEAEAMRKEMQCAVDEFAKS